MKAPPNRESQLAVLPGQSDEDSPVSIPLATALGAADDLPVVARLVVEIRSDGTRTIARGGIEDQVLGQRVTIEARGDSPLQLALALAKSLSSLPALAARKGPNASSGTQPNMERTSERLAAGPTATRLLRTALSPRRVMRGLLGKKK